MSRLLKNACLRRFPHPSPFNVPPEYASRLRISGACIQTFLNSLDQQFFKRAVTCRSGVLKGSFDLN